ncbi:MAG: cell division protein SepF [Lachnospiraceae bacterium]|nr:cell division protein SepF [Lachnospiraceae bacterium]
MGFMESFLGKLELGDEETLDNGDYLDGGEAEEDIPRTTAKGAAAAPVAEDRRPLNKPGAGRNKRLGNGMEVVCFKPTTVNDSREIVDTLIANRTVVLNMEGLEKSIAQMVFDFSSGGCYALGGNLQQISDFIFLITPASVDVSGDFSNYISDSSDRNR